MWRSERPRRPTGQPVICRPNPKPACPCHRPATPTSSPSKHSPSSHEAGASLTIAHRPCPAPHDPTLLRELASRASHPEPRVARAARAIYGRPRSRPAHPPRRQGLRVKPRTSRNSGKPEETQPPLRARPRGCQAESKQAGRGRAEWRLARASGVGGPSAGKSTTQAEGKGVSVCVPESGSGAMLNLLKGTLMPLKASVTARLT